jgi:GDP-L-fucose synthase
LFALAARTGNIKVNGEIPADIYRDNILIGTNTLDAARMAGVGKITQIIPSCSYPGDKELLSEHQFLDGPSHPSVACHGLARRSSYLYGKLLNNQYGLDVSSVVVNNSYSELESVNLEKTKFFGSLVKKFVDAKRNDDPCVTVWGTGKPRREVIHGEDVARGLIAVAESKKEFPLINIGTGVDYSIKEYAQMIRGIVGYKGEIEFDTSKTDGQCRKLLDVSFMEKDLSFEPSIGIIEGVLRVVKSMEAKP